MAWANSLYELRKENEGVEMCEMDVQEHQCLHGEICISNK